MARNATIPQTKIARIPGATTFWMIPWTLTAELPTDAIAAPISPPIRAWLELDGIVKYQVIRFQVIAPINAASTTTSPSAPAVAAAGTIPLAIVVATLIEMNAPTKLSAAEIRTATIGFSAPVAIDVAIALAVSWKPFVKSNATAATITTTRMNVDPMPRAAFQVC